MQSESESGNRCNERDVAPIQPLSPIEEIAVEQLGRAVDVARCIPRPLDAAAKQIELECDRSCCQRGSRGDVGCAGWSPPSVERSHVAPSTNERERVSWRAQGAAIPTVTIRGIVHLAA